jgi:hypothetical protein
MTDTPVPPPTPPDPYGEPAAPPVRRGGFADILATVLFGVGVLTLVAGASRIEGDDGDARILLQVLAVVPLSASALYAAFSHIDGLVVRIFLGLVIVAAVVLLLLGGCAGYLSALDFHGPNTPADQSRRMTLLVGGGVGLAIIPGFGMAIVLDAIRRWSARR